MSFEGVDARCMITKLDVKNIMKMLNERRISQGDKVEVVIDEVSSRCLREYIDLILMDVANKYVKMSKETNNNGNDKEKLIIDTILRQSNHLITNDKKSRQTLNECFLMQTNENDNAKTPLNSIFLKD